MVERFCDVRLGQFIGHPGSYLGVLLAVLWNVKFVHGYDSYSSTFTSLGFVIFVVFFIIVGVCVCIRFAKRRSAYAGQIIAPPSVTVYTQQGSHQPGLVQAGPYVVQSHYQQQPMNQPYHPAGTSPYPPASTAGAPYPSQAWYPAPGVPPAPPVSDNFVQPGQFAEPLGFERPPPTYDEVMGPPGQGSSSGAHHQNGMESTK